MGKIRVKTIGLEENDKEQDKKARQNEAKKIEAAKRLEAKNAAKDSDDSKEIKVEVQTTKSEEASEVKAKKSEVKETKKPKTSKYKASKKAHPHSAAYLAMVKQIDKDKKYTLVEAIKILNSGKKAKFDETVELHINTLEKGVSGSLTLPHGTGKTSKIEIADYTADPKHVEELVKTITGGQINFDILIATPETMAHLAKVARVLGPKGLMPNPKNGTISQKPKEALRKFEGGQVNFKTEAKFPIIHLSIGKLSFEEKKLVENIKALIQAIKASNIKSVTLKSTMSPGIKVAI